MSRGELAGVIWPKVCHHLNGMAMAGLVAVLGESGALAALEARPEGMDAEELATASRLHPAYLALALRLLTTQGFTETNDGRARFTPLGREWRGAGIPYHLAGGAMRAAAGFAAWLHGGGAEAAGPWQGMLEIEAGPGWSLWEEGARHLTGAMMAAVMRGFCRHGLWEKLATAGEGGLATARLGLNPAALAAAGALMAAQGWAVAGPGRLALTPEGGELAAYAPQYFAPLSYLPTLKAAGDFLRGKSLPADLGREAGGGESHLDRRLDIEFSGLVFKRGCADAFFAAVLPIFDAPLAGQPDWVVDVGCGDATLLIELYRAVAERAERGRHLQTRPLGMAGVEYNPQARQTAEERLAAAGVPSLTLAGDIARPAELAAGLAARGVDPARVLYVSKSVVHNRGLQTTAAPAPAGLPESGNVFVTRRGRLVPPREMNAELADFFRRWLPHAAHHGMVVVEAHTVDASLAAPHRHRHLFTCTEAYHGLSGQFLLEAEVHRRAYRAAGFRAVSRADLGRGMVGEPTMTVDYLRPAGHGEGKP